MKRPKFYTILLVSAFLLSFTLGILLMSGKNFEMAGAVYFLIFCVVPSFITSIIVALAYEFYHPVKNDFSDKNVKSNSYNSIILVLSIIIIWTLATIIIYLLPIINNLTYINSTSWYNYDTRYYYKDDFSLNNLLFYGYIKWRYVLLVLTSLTLILAIKKVKYTNIPFLLVIILIIVMEFTGVGFIVYSDSINYSKNKVEKLIGIYNSNIAVNNGDVSFCGGDFIDKSVCIQKVAFKNNDNKLCSIISDDAKNIRDECMSHFIGK